MIDLDIYYYLRSEAEYCLPEEEYSKFSEFIKNLEDKRDMRILFWGLLIGEMGSGTELDKVSEYFYKELNDHNENN